jgi:peptide/nickel transport system ATP-binding protein/oligopeptide transport system ATP-binding protein
MTDPLLSVENLRTYFYTPYGVVKAVNGVNFELESGKALGIIGESGSGKTVTGLSIMRLIFPPGKILKGSRIMFQGEDLLLKPENEMRSVRGNRISMVFQDPMTSLNPVFTIGEQLTRVIQTHQDLTKKEAIEKAITLLKEVGISDPEKRIKNYPHQFSGGMRQRVLIAMAISCHPNLIIADEPTTALDVTTQAKIIELLKDLQRKIGTSLIFITHDLALISEIVSEVIVMYCGMILERGEVDELLSEPLHPYTEGLLHSLPDVNIKGDLQPIEGTIPSPINPPSGCKFHPRCKHATVECREDVPEFKKIRSDRYVSCILY